VERLWRCGGEFMEAEVCRLTTRDCRVKYFDKEQFVIDIFLGEFEDNHDLRR
jgi:hypothetical protein